MSGQIQVCYFKSHLTDEEQHQIPSSNCKLLFGQSENAPRAGLSSLRFSGMQIKLLEQQATATFCSSPQSVSGPSALLSPKRKSWSGRHETVLPLSGTSWFSLCCVRGGKGPADLGLLKDASHHLISFYCLEFFFLKSYFVVVVPFHLVKKKNENRLLLESSFRRNIQQADFSQEVSVLRPVKQNTVSPTPPTLLLSSSMSGRSEGFSSGSWHCRLSNWLLISQCPG